MNKILLEQKVLLWKQMQSMVVTIEERNHKMMSLGTIIPTLITVISALFEKTSKELSRNFYIMYIFRYTVYSAFCNLFNYI